MFASANICFLNIENSFGRQTLTKKSKDVQHIPVVKKINNTENAENSETSDEEADGEESEEETDSTLAALTGEGGGSKLNSALFRTSQFTVDQLGGFTYKEFESVKALFDYVQ